MKYTIEFTEVIAYLSQDIEADSEQEATEKAFELMENDVIPIANSNMDYCVSTERKEEPEPVTIIDPSLEAYIDGVALNTLYQNYHKGTNGIWSRAEVVYQGTFEPNFGIETEKEYWEVGVSYGKADDCGSEDYYDKIYVWKVSGSGLQVVTEDYKPVDFTWRYNLQEKV